LFKGLIDILLWSLTSIISKLALIGNACRAPDILYCGIN